MAVDRQAELRFQIRSDYHEKVPLIIIGAEFCCIGQLSENSYQSIGITIGQYSS